MTHNDKNKNKDNDNDKDKEKKKNTSLTMFGDLKFNCFSPTTFVVERRTSFVYDFFFTGEFEPFILHEKKDLIILDKILDDESDYYFDKQKKMFLRYENDKWDRVPDHVIHRLKKLNKNKLKQYIKNTKNPVTENLFIPSFLQQRSQSF